MRVKNLIMVLWVLTSPNLGNAQVWRGVGGGCDSVHGVKNLFNHNDLLYVAGDFNSVNGTPISALGFAIWDSSNWVNTNITFNNTGYPTCFTSFNNDVYMGGNFGKINGNTYCKDVAKFDGTNWLPLGSGVTNGFGVYTMTEYANDIYVGGQFTIVDSTISARRIARWDGSQWHAMGTGFTGGLTVVHAMTVYNGELYVGGEFTSIDGISVSNVCRWNGVSWDSLGLGLNGTVRAFVVDTINNLLYVGGEFTASGNKNLTSCIASWDGNNWSEIGTAPYLFPHALEMYNGKLFAAGGSYGLVNSLGDTIKEIAWFDGVNWQPACTEIDMASVETLKSYKNELYAGGYFQHINDSIVYGIARLNFPNVKVDEIESQNSDIKVFPNPAKEELLVSIEKNPLSLKSWTLINAEGKTLLKGKVSKSFKVNISEIKPGNYFLLFMFDNKVIKSKPIIISK